jgi:hypothetical protein
VRVQQCECDRHFTYHSPFLSPVLRNCLIRRFGPPGSAGFLPREGTHPFWIKRGVCPLHNLMSRYGHQKTRKYVIPSSGKNILQRIVLEKIEVSRCASATVRVRQTLHIPFPFPFPSATELSGTTHWPTGRSWLSAPRGHTPLLD